jgi:hypothetical protein
MQDEVTRNVYPFIRTEFTLYEEEGACTLPSWEPGVIRTDAEEGIAHGLGLQILTLLHVINIPSYRTRVIYNQTWVDPDGKSFGKKTLRFCSLRKYMSLRGGFRFPYVIKESV